MLKIYWQAAALVKKQNTALENTQEQKREHRDLRTHGGQETACLRKTGLTKSELDPELRADEPWNKKLGSRTADLSGFNKLWSEFSVS